MVFILLLVMPEMSLAYLDIIEIITFSKWLVYCREGVLWRIGWKNFYQILIFPEVFQWQHFLSWKLLRGLVGVTLMPLVNG